MLQVSVSVEHRLGRDKALSRLKRSIDELFGQFGGQAESYQCHWRGSHADFFVHAKGRKAKGTIHVEQRAAVVTATIEPGRFYERPVIEKAIRKYLHDVLQ